MTGKKENIKLLFSNTRSRVIIIFTVVLLLLAVLVGYIKLKSIGNGPEASADLSSTPGSIQSIPGALDPTAQYAKLQEEQNITQAKQAMKTGASAIPTIIKTQALGEGVGVVGSENKKNTGVGFATLTREDQEGPQYSLWIQNLQNSGCSKSAITKVVSEGAKLSDLKAACSCVQLKENGYSLENLNSVCACKELKAAGFNARQLKDAGYSATQLRECTFNACELRNSGFTAQEMKDAGFIDGELKGAGFTEVEINNASGLPDGVSAGDVLKAGCTANSLSKLRSQEVSASAIRRISGCSVNQLKIAGFKASELKSAGFSAADLKVAGFTPDELKATNFTNADLANAGYNVEEIKAAIPMTDAQIRAAGVDPVQLNNLFKAGVSAKRIKELNGANAEALKNAGFSAESLITAGFTPEELKAVGFTDRDLSQAGIIAMGRASGTNVDLLNKARNAGISAATIKQTLGSNAVALKAGGYSAKQLKDAGFTAAELKNAGFNVNALKAAGYSAKELKDAGFSSKNLKDAGFSAGQLKAIGFSPKELMDAGFSAAELKAAGFSPKELMDAGFSAKDLKDAGFSPKELMDAGFSAKDLKDAGFLAAELKAAGYNEIDLQKAGYSPDELRIAGIGNPNMSQGAFSFGGIPANSQVAQGAEASTQQLQAILNKQNEKAAEQKYQQKIQQKSSDMLSAANQALSDWKTAPTQAYTEGNNALEETSENQKSTSGSSANNNGKSTDHSYSKEPNQPPVIKTGDILFAVMDTAVNSDEPGPILATIVSGKLKGTKLIGSFNLASQNASKMVITFNTMSIPGASKTTSISAYAIDPDTARTALSSKTNHHYLMRYGSLFASSFLQGIGTAFQSADTSVSVGGTGGVTNTTVQNGINRSTMDNAIIALTNVGQAWGQQAQQVFNTPTTIEVYSGSPLGILFTQDVQIN